MTSDPYCTATINGRRCYAFAADSQTRLCASHNPESIHRRRVTAAKAVLPRLRDERGVLLAKLNALTDKLVDLDQRIAEYDQAVERGYFDDGAWR